MARTPAVKTDRMTMTAYDIIAELSMPPDKYFRCEVIKPFLADNTGPRAADAVVCLRVRPLRTMDKGQTFEVPREGAIELMCELNAIFESARTLTA